MSGVTATGFSKLTLAEIKSEWETTFKQAFGNSINLRPPSLMATVIGIASEREAKIWDLAEEDYNSKAPSTAQGVALANVGEITNEEFIPAAPSKIFDQIFFGDVGTVIDTSLVLSVSGNSLAKFSPVASVTLGAGTDAVQLLAFSAVPDAGTWTITLPDGQVTGSLAFGANAAAIQTAIQLLSGWEDVTVSGNYTSGFTVTFTDSSGLQPQKALIGNSSLTASAVAVTITQSDTTVGVAQGTATVAALVDGPTVADSGSLTVIDTPVTGLSSTKNLSDATLGRLVETDAEFRIRRESELQNSSSATLEAIRVRLKKVADVVEAIVYENTSLATDGNGVPGKAIHAYVQGGDDQAIADALWLAVGGGIETFGTVVKTVFDSQGLPQTVKFDRPTNKAVYVMVNITKNVDLVQGPLYPVDGDQMVKDAIEAYGQLLKIGEDVLVYPKLLPAIVDNVPGIFDISVKVGFSPSPTLSANLIQLLNEIATFDTANMTVVSV